MLVPTLSFLLGLVVLVVSFTIYRGAIGFKHPLFIEKLAHNSLFLWGNFLIALAAMLGVAGYWNIFHGGDLRLGRILLLIFGLILSCGSILESLGEKNPLRSLQVLEKLRQLGNLKIISYSLTGISILTLASIFLIAFCDYNYGGDAFMYHVPFAARLWKIVSPEQYTFEYFTEHRFEGFPLLANWLQGLFWIVFQRIEATNLVAYTSLIILITYLVRILKIPFYLATLSLLAIPMVHMHASRSYIDLPGNVGISILILTIYLLYIQRIKLDAKSIAIVVFSAASSANTKHQFIPIVFLSLLFFLPLLIRKYGVSSDDTKISISRIGKILILSGFISLFIFSTSIKNIVLYQNPFFPVKIEIGGKVLNHTEAPPDFMNPNLRKLAPPLRWGRSVLEIDVFDKRRPWPWTLAMDFISWDEERFGLGGYFGGYVIFNLILLLYLCWRDWTVATKTALVLVLIISIITSFIPQSYELRYYMYWMIVLVSLNTFLVSRFAEVHGSLSNPIKPQYLGLITLIFMLIFIHKTNRFFTYPSFQPLSQQLRDTEMLDKKILNNIKEGEKVCLVGKAPNTFFYSSYFHPPRNYSIRGEFTLDNKWIQEKCKGWKIIR